MVTPRILAKKQDTSILLPNSKPQKTDYLYQVIQSVTFSSPNVGGHLVAFPKGHVNSPSQKGHVPRTAR